MIFYVVFLIYELRETSPFSLFSPLTPRLVTLQQLSTVPLRQGVAHGQTPSDDRNIFRKILLFCF
nr:MAG TPA: hypothetical protein [Caudoviricetes sp.]DAN93712.1 MAG TPA: hypothetical protein [Caudoviricetes sp.]DAS80675.1 MAG TPA: hypothetical protein [Caudoviricetes sp.]